MRGNEEKKTSFSTDLFFIFVEWWHFGPQNQLVDVAVDRDVKGRGGKRGGEKGWVGIVVVTGHFAKLLQGLFFMYVSLKMSEVVFALCFNPSRLLPSWKTLQISIVIILTTKKKKMSSQVC